MAAKATTRSTHITDVVAPSTAALATTSYSSATGVRSTTTASAIANGTPSSTKGDDWFVDTGAGSMTVKGMHDKGQGPVRHRVTLAAAIALLLVVVLPSAASVYGDVSHEGW